MLLTFVDILKALWPFLKESILQGGTIGNWLLRNIITCIWILLLLTMLGVVLYLGDIAKQLQSQVVYRAREAGTLRLENQQLKAKVESLRGKLTEARRVNGTLTDQVESHDAWLARCGLPHNHAPTAPCPATKPPQQKPAPQTKPEPQPQPKRNRFKDRIRALLRLPPT